MPKNRLFLDSSALFAGVISPTGASRALLVLAEVGEITIIISEQVIVETERSLARKVPLALPDFRQTIKDVNPRIVTDPSTEEVRANLYLITDPTDVPILVAAMKEKVDFLVTLDRLHFLDDPKVAEKSGLRIGSPIDALIWVREREK